MAQYMTANEVAQLYRVSRHTVYRWTMEGRLHPFKAGRQNLYEVEEVESLIKPARGPRPKEARSKSDNLD
jgi:excisionase family DNA binding protein